jgi:uncharacterized protein with FMN-binding domain
MRRITAWLLATVSGIVLLVSYHTSTMGAAPPPAPLRAAGEVAPDTTRTPTGLAAPATAPTAPTSPTFPTAATSPTAPTAERVVNGAAVSTRWGTVQVQVHVRDGRIVDVVPLAVPDSNGHDFRVNSYAVPLLHDEVLAAQSANVDTVSGATVTSNGYIRSLQAALDAVHLARS